MYMILRRVGVSGRHGVERRFFLEFVVVGEFSGWFMAFLFGRSLPNFSNLFATLFDISCFFFLLFGMH